ncbi:glycosyltransferase family 39 protein [Sphingomonas azotifigens]|uniref:glycosyltransferase family 39 protein n=1 Tax=Sphingomonas azotifigens TaxID=330920 RepID=UPI001C3FB4A0|nr:glycosyltransferase family 39 protein [Sphingomonas azotifigens]
MSATSAGSSRSPSPWLAGGSRRRLAVLATILVVATALRFALADYSLWFDEYAALFFAHQPYARLWSDWMVRETNPPLYYSILHGWIELIGPMDRVTLRVPTILANLLTIAVAYFGVARHYGERAAALGAMLLAVSAQQIFYAHQVRGYSFLALALTVSFFGLMRIVAAEERGTRDQTGAWLSFVGGAIAAIYLHVTALLWVPIATLALLAVDRRFVPLLGRDWWRLALADLAIAVGALWALYIVYQQTQVPNPNISWMHFLGIRGALKLYWASSLLARDPFGIQALSAGLLFAAAVFGIVRTARQRTTQLAVLCWVGAVCLFFLFSLKQPVLVERTLVWMAIFPVTLACAGASTLRGRRTFLVVAGVLIAAGGANLAATYAGFAREEWDGAIRQVLDDPKSVLIVSGEGDAVVSDYACKFLGRRDQCPVPIIALSGENHNAWASGYGPKVSVTEQGRLAVSPQSNVYLIQRYDGRTLRVLHAAGLLRDVQGRSGDLVFLGPFGPPALADIERVACVRDNMLESACPALPPR